MSNANGLMVQAAAVGVDGLAAFNGGTSPSGGSWPSNQNEALDKSSSYHVNVFIAYNKPDTMFAAVLVCSFNEATKILRKEVAVCPIAAARAIVHGLHVDSGLLLINDTI
ncbi:hypothetical protein BU25DRAFT_456501 [Macroventuria anomochaeta]|uniref:Uncharacterized protein n=1 Tax=Macroventuria anomochaeta TaxID=301207 RepID=A0ACB6S750_9PLEO|nr:uncharacterized protein BU25DRAFT_456501 [Macroventuria anomochaeta]KAF2630095.1 hypothetical protein BU25DRAFT_456501 [Macroventuria anomochaeta]